MWGKYCIGKFWNIWTLFPLYCNMQIKWRFFVRFLIYCIPSLKYLIFSFLGTETKPNKIGNGGKRSPKWSSFSGVKCTDIRNETITNLCPYLSYNKTYNTIKDEWNFLTLVCYLQSVLKLWQFLWWMIVFKRLAISEWFSKLW